MVDPIKLELQLSQAKGENLALQKSLERVNAEKAGLTSTIAARDTFIASLNTQKLGLANQATELAAQLKAQRNELQSLSMQLASSQKSLAAKDLAISKHQSELAAFRQEITLLKTQGISEGQLRTDFESLRIRANVLEQDNGQKNVQLSQMRTEYASVAARLEELKGFAEGLQIQSTELQKQKDAIAQELATLNQRSQSAFTPDNLADYLTKTIDLFNRQTNTSSQYVNYIINEMDVDLKAMVGKNDKNEMILAAPSLGAPQEQAMSTIKLSIRAVPKE